MAYNVTVKDLKPQPVVCIRTRCKREALGDAFADILPAAFKYVATKGGVPMGRPYSRLISIAEDGTLEYEGGVPVMKPLPAEGRVLSDTLPGGPTAVTMHVGPYDQLGEAYEAMARWCAENGHTPAGMGWESYVSDPGKEPDPSKWQTQCFLPLAPK